MKTMGHQTPAMFRRYADLFSEEEERAQQIDVQERRRQWRESQPQGRVVVMPGKASELGIITASLQEKGRPTRAASLLELAYL